jgi:pSer/pThr/pTyr-binding forkhead associated (FHA) protein
MDLFERFSSKFGQWYESLFGAGTGELRPRDILRKITGAMEDHRKEGFDGKVYVPNRYVLEIAVADADERDYLLSFLDEEELVSVLQKFMAQNNYHTRGPIDFTVAEVDASSGVVEKLKVKARYERGATSAEIVKAEAEPEAAVVPGGNLASSMPHEPLKAISRSNAADADELPTVAAIPTEDEEEPGTVPAVAWASLAVTEVDGHKSHYSLTKPVMMIGRSRNSANDIILAGDGMASKQHARIERERDGRFTLYDLGSMNGVAVNGVRIGQNRILSDGDEIVIGATKLVFQQAGAPPLRKRLSPPGKGEDRGEPPVVIGKQRASRMVLNSGEEHVLGSETVIGRALTSDIVFEDASVSTRHARVVSVDLSTYYIEDLGSDHGTRVNGRTVAAGQRALLADGDVVVVGNRVLQFVAGGR